MHYKRLRAMKGTAAALAVCMALTQGGMGVYASGGGNHTLQASAKAEESSMEDTDGLEKPGDVPQETPDAEQPELPPVPKDPERPEETPVPEAPEQPEETPSVTPAPEKPEEKPEAPSKPEESPAPDATEPPKESPALEEPKQETDKPKETEQPEETAPATSNEELIRSQEIIKAPVIEEDFRYVTVEKEYALLQTEAANVYEEMSKDAKVVGTMGKGDLCFLLKEADEWAYIESGSVRGFVEKEQLLIGTEAEKTVKNKELKHQNLSLKLESLQEKLTDTNKDADRNAADTKEEGTDVASEAKTVLRIPVEQLKKDGRVKFRIDVKELKTVTQKDTASKGTKEADEQEKQLLQELKANTVTYAKAAIAPIENEALAYTHTTTQQTVVERIPAVAHEETAIRAGTEKDSQAAGILKEGGICYVLADDKAEEIYVESGDVRGFVKRSSLLLDDEAETALQESGEEARPLAEEQMEPEENPVLYYTFTSIKEGQIASTLRGSIIEFAGQFVGNPYVWGGTSLTGGADCSGFVQTIYNDYYGFDLPRVAQDQAYYGTKIRVEDAMPGDLVFYARGGEIYHVVIYAGNGRTIEAQSTKTGIVEGTLHTEDAVWATRLVDDTDNERIKAVNQKAESQNKLTAYQNAEEGQAGELLGNFKLTAYCNCALCCGQWADGATASGTVPTEGRTVAMGGIPFGTKLVINGYVYTVEDRGTPYGHVDIFMNSHDDCNAFGVGYADVYLLKE